MFFSLVCELRMEKFKFTNFEIEKKIYIRVYLLAVSDALKWNKVIKRSLLCWLSFFFILTIKIFYVGGSKQKQKIVVVVQI